jgi:hypothetical protein
MMKTTATGNVSPQTLRQWAETKKPFFLIDTLTHDHYRAIHLPEAQHACVFEVTFFDQIASITTDKHACIVLYGASGRTMDAAVAAENPTGTFVIDMNAIENKSLAGDDLQPVLLSHLKSDDFFFTRRFPTATLTIRSGMPTEEPFVSAPTSMCRVDSP